MGIFLLLELEPHFTLTLFGIELSINVIHRNLIERPGSGSWDRGRERKSEGEKEAIDDMK